MPSIEFNSNVVKKLFHNTNPVKKLFLNGIQVWQDAILPIGIIIGYAGTEAPSGWELFSNADDKLIVGAGNLYTSGTTGGNNNLSSSLSLATSGYHSTGIVVTVATASSRGYGGNTTAGGHSHTVTVSGVYSPYRHQIGFIKALEESNLPLGGIIFSASDISSDIEADNVNTTSAYLSSNQLNRTLTGSDVVSLSGTSTSSGAHNHGNQTANGNAISGQIAYNFTTTHTHTVAVSITPNIKAKYLTAWSNALKEISICPNVIGMYEGENIPDGWAVCDGTNGTPDLRDYFIRLGGVNNAGSEYSSGGNTSIPSTTTSTNAHTHSFGSTGRTDANDGGGHSTSISHSHNTAASTIVVVPTYYALTFIMKLS